VYTGSVTVSHWLRIFAAQQNDRLYGSMFVSVDELDKVPDVHAVIPRSRDFQSSEATGGWLFRTGTR
jgi:hypothetical protein